MELYYTYYIMLHNMTYYIMIQDDIMLYNMTLHYIIQCWRGEGGAGGWSWRVEAPGALSQPLLCCVPDAEAQEAGGSLEAEDSPDPPAGAQGACPSGEDQEEESKRPTFCCRL